MQNKFYTFLYRAFSSVLRFFYPHHQVCGTENIRSSAVYVGHYQMAYGPINTIINFPINLHLWVYERFFDRDSCYNQYVNITFTRTFGWPKFLAVLVGWPLSYFASALTASGKCIPVYRDSRLGKTFRMSMDVLKKGESILIMGDRSYASHNAEMVDIYEGFLYLEKYYFREFKEHLNFIPVYAHRKNRTLTISEPIQFNTTADFKTESARISAQILDAINQMADA